MARINRDSRPLTVVEAFRRLSTNERRGFTFIDTSSRARPYSYAKLYAAAETRGRAMLGLGYRPGDRVAMVLAQPEDFVVTFLGCLLAGLVPVPMFPPLSFGKLDAWADSAVNILGVAGASLLVTDGQLSSILWQVMPRVETLRDLYTVDRLDSAAPLAARLPEVHPDDLAFLQFTSGSTSAPKGVMVTHGSLLANAWSIATEGMDLDDEVDRAVSWLPLYHDMGLIGFVVTPLVSGLDVTFIPTLSFVKRPNVWMQAMHDYQATVSFGPNFAYALAAKRAGEKELSAWDLSRVRILGCGAEPINPGVMTEFTRAFARCGLKSEAVMPAYGMAEATLAITFAPRLPEVGVATVDAEVFRAEGRVVPALDDSIALRFVNCGRPFGDHEVVIIDGQGNPLPAGREGEIVVRGPSITAGYWKNPDATREAFQDGWLRTGDLGFLLDGCVYISGRCKDLIILNGKNHHPQTIEWAVQDLEGVRRGNVVAFSRPGRDSEELVVVCEVKPDAPADLAEAISRAVADQLSLRVAEVVRLQVGQLPKTSSGKLQRRKTREQYLSGELGQEGVRTLGATGERLTVARHIARSLIGRASHAAKGLFRGAPVPAAG